MENGWLTRMTVAKLMKVNIYEKNHGNIVKLRRIYKFLIHKSSCQSISVNKNLRNSQ